MKADAFVGDRLQFTSLTLENYMMEIFGLRLYKVDRVQAHLFDNSLYSAYSDIVEKSIKSLELDLLMLV